MGIGAGIISAVKRYSFWDILVTLTTSILVAVPAFWLGMLLQLFFGVILKDATGGAFSMPLKWTIMATLGLVMMAIFAYIYFALLDRLEQAVTASDWSAGGLALARIRSWVGVNLVIGVVIVVQTLLM